MRGVAMMVGAIVGVGVFGLPYVFAQTGFAPTVVLLLIMGALLTILQLMQAEVAIQAGGHHRLAGFVRRYLGPGWAWLALMAIAAGTWGAMLAYMIVGGKFLFLFVSPLLGGTEFFYALSIAVIAGLLIYRGLRFASKIEMVVVGILLFLFLFIILASIPHITPSNWLSVSLDNVFLPYGVILFSLAGVGIIPEIKDVLGKRLQSQFGRVILMGMAIIVLLYVLFSAAVLGVTGSATTQVAFDGLIPALGSGFGLVATFLGTLTILSIYLMLGIELLNTLKFDFHLSHGFAWIFVTFIPMGAYMLGAREFIQVISFVGSVFAGALGILIALTYAKMKKSMVCNEHVCLDFPHFLTWLLILLFAGGILYSIFL